VQCWVTVMGTAMVMEAMVTLMVAVREGDLMILKKVLRKSRDSEETRRNNLQRILMSGQLLFM